GDGIRWEMMVDMPFPFPAPGMAHGSAGVGLMFAELYRATRNQTYLDAAIGGANYAWSHRRSTGSGCLIPHLLGIEPPRFYLSNCHGPAGTSRLFTVLAEITSHAEWEQRSAALLAGYQDLGVPEQRSEGLWQNHGQCCGDAGIGDFALWRYERTGDPTDVDLADRAAAVILAAADLDDGKRSWVMAEHRDRPDFLQRQTGYFQGAAGIGSFLVHLHTAHGGPGQRIWLPDYPGER
ncbi:MAG TPA: lanthionine synthetase LanC family protein, partial [Ilumatobacteraceae bacterium]|nr:lanthionine synthetase LanC family protein [Ilumatobacteraceae bacterium]